MRSIFTTILSVVAAFTMLGCEQISIDVITNDAYFNKTSEQSIEINGESKNCAVVLRAQQGTSYSITIESVGNWAHFSSEALTVEGTMESTEKVVYIYFSKNSSGTSREALINVEFSNNTHITLTLTQHSS